MAKDAIALIAGLGNPGGKYTETRHNAGFWFLDALEKTYGFSLAEDKRYKGLIGSFTLEGQSIRVIAPQTFMNLSGDSVLPYARFYRIPPEQILVAYDELDLNPGIAKIKLDGGHGGHNGLRDIIQKGGARNFKRLRIGIGHPGDSRKVSGYVLSKPSKDDRISIENAIARSVKVLPSIVAGDIAGAMNILHTDN